jgi:hypothetical protein
MTKKNNNDKSSTGKRAREEGEEVTKDEKGNNIYPLPVGHSTDRNSKDPNDIALRKKARDIRKKQEKKKKKRTEAEKAETEGEGLQGRVTDEVQDETPDNSTNTLPPLTTQDHQDLLQLPHLHVHLLPFHPDARKVLMSRARATEGLSTEHTKLLTTLLQDHQLLTTLPYSGEGAFYMENSNIVQNNDVRTALLATIQMFTAAARTAGLPEVPPSTEVLIEGLLNLMYDTEMNMTGDIEEPHPFGDSNALALTKKARTRGLQAKKERDAATIKTSTRSISILTEGEDKDILFDGQALTRDTFRLSLFQVFLPRAMTHMMRREPEPGVPTVPVSTLHEQFSKNVLIRACRFNKFNTWMIEAGQDHTVTFSMMLDHAMGVTGTLADQTPIDNAMAYEELKHQYHSATIGTDEDPDLFADRLRHIARRMSTFGTAPTLMDSLQTLMKAAAEHARYTSITDRYAAHPGADSFEVLVTHLTNTKKAADRKGRQAASDDLKINQLLAERASEQAAAKDEAAFKEFQSNKNGNRGGGDGGAGKQGKSPRNPRRELSAEEKADMEAFKKEMVAAGHQYHMPDRKDARATGRLILNLADHSGVVKECTKVAAGPKQKGYFLTILEIWREALKNKGVALPAKPEWMRN